MISGVAQDLIRSREIASVTALTILGNAPSQLKVHIHGALNVGCTKEGSLRLSCRWWPSRVSLDFALVFVIVF